MATTKEIHDEAQLAKSYIAGSDLPDDSKRTYLRLITITADATNGVTQEEKIQKMTESIFLLAASQAKYMIGLDRKIDEAVARANQRQCRECKAMKFTEEAEERRRQEELIEQWKKANGYDDKAPKQAGSSTWAETARTILVKPWVYIFLTLALVSPYGVQIIEKLLQAFGG